MNEHIVIINPKEPKEGLLDVIQDFLEKDGLRTVRRRIVIIENGKVFIMEGTAAKPNKRLLGKVPKVMKHVTGRCYVYLTTEISEGSNIANTMKQIKKNFGPNYISQSANEAQEMKAVLFG